MASLNKVQLIGNLGKDPEVRYSPTGVVYATVDIATSRHWKNEGGEKKEATDWHRVVFAGKLAKVVEQYLKGGNTIYVEGRLNHRNYTDKDGVVRYVTEVRATNLQMLRNKKNDVAGQTTVNEEDQIEHTEHAEAEYDDIPF